MLKLTNIHKNFKNNEVLRGVNLTVDTGQVVSLIGPSGTGKTTLLRCANFLEKPDAGQISLSGIDVNISNANKKDILKIRRKTAMVFQNYNLFKNKNVLQNVMEPQIVAQKKSKREAREVALEELNRVGLANKMEAFPSSLSGGEQQRVGIARALAVDPEVIFFDEPTSALDPELVKDVLEAIAEVASLGKTILLVTHEMEFARQISNKVVFMENGSIVEQGTPEEIFEHSKNDRTRQFLSKFYYERDEKRDYETN